MKITITFDSLEEFKKHIIGVPEAAPAQKAPEAPQSDEEPKPKKNPKKAEKPQEEDAGQPDEAPAPEVSEDFRVEVRKTLAKLNKKVGKNSRIGEVDAMKEPFEKTATQKIRRFLYKTSHGDEPKK